MTVKQMYEIVDLPDDLATTYFTVDVYDHKLGVERVLYPYALFGNVDGQSRGTRGEVNNVIQETVTRMNDANPTLTKYGVYPPRFLLALAVNRLVIEHLESKYEGLVRIDEIKPNMSLYIVKCDAGYELRGLVSASLCDVNDAVLNPLMDLMRHTADSEIKVAMTRVIRGRASSWTGKELCDLINNLVAHFKRTCVATISIGASTFDHAKLAIRITNPGRTTDWEEASPHSPIDTFERYGVLCGAQVELASCLEAMRKVSKMLKNDEPADEVVAFIEKHGHVLPQH